MRRLHLMLLTVVSCLLAAPAAAPAKEVSEVRVCGIDAHCTTYDTSEFKSLMFLAQDDGPTDPPAAAAPWYRVRFTVDEREHGGGHARWTVAYVPSAASLRVREDGGKFTWVALNPRAAAVLERAARSLPALPSARLIGVRAEARVDEPVAPARRTAVTTAGPTPAIWIVAAVALGAALLLGALGGVVRHRRHGRPAGV